MPTDPIRFTCQTLLAGTQAAAAAAAALNGGVDLACQEVRVQADPDNAQDIFVGNAAVQPYELNAGDGVMIRINNVAKIFVLAPVGAPVVNWLAWR